MKRISIRQIQGLDIRRKGNKPSRTLLKIKNSNVKKTLFCSPVGLEVENPKWTNIPEFDIKENEIIKIQLIHEQVKSINKFIVHEHGPLGHFALSKLCTIVLQTDHDGDFSRSYKVEIVGNIIAYVEVQYSVVTYAKAQSQPTLATQPNYTPTVSEPLPNIVPFYDPYAMQNPSGAQNVNQHHSSQPQAVTPVPVPAPAPVVPELKQNSSPARIGNNENQQSQNNNNQNEKKVVENPHFQSLGLSNELQTYLVEIEESAKQQGFNIKHESLRFIRQMAQGGFGEVWEAEWSACPVAVKKILNFKISEKDVKDFCAEVLLMSKLRHPNIVQFLGVCVSPEFCLVLEYVDKGSLFHVLKREKNLSWDIKVNFIKNIVSGMVYLHSNGIVHRDIKSLNILVNSNYKASITDFGLTKIKQKQEMLHTRCGSPAWTAPEVFIGKPYNEKADVYSFAIVLWEILAGLPPYAGMDQMVVINKVAFENFRPNIPLCPYPQLIELMVLCWNGNPELRPSFPKIWELLSTYSLSGH